MMETRRVMDEIRPSIPPSPRKHQETSSTSRAHVGVASKTVVWGLSPSKPRLAPPKGGSWGLRQSPSQLWSPGPCSLWPVWEAACAPLVGPDEPSCWVVCERPENAGKRNWGTVLKGVVWVRVDVGLLSSDGESTLPQQPMFISQRFES